MQWTNDSGGRYGEDPYGGAGHAYVHGHRYGGDATTGMATPAWGPEEVGLAQWTTHPEDSAHAPWPDPRTAATSLFHAPVAEFPAAGTPLHAPGPATSAEAWEVPHHDVLAVPPPETDSPGIPAPGPRIRDDAPARPVFVDSSGRRQRRVLRAARLLVIPAGGYVALLVSTVLGGPSISSPFVPQPGAADPATPRATAPDASPGTGHSTYGAKPGAVGQNSRSTARETTGPTVPSEAPTAPAPTSAPTTTPSRITSPTTTAVSVPPPSAKGRSIGATHRPVK